MRRLANMISIVGVSIILLVKMSLVVSQSNGLSQTNILNGKHLKIATAAVRINLLKSKHPKI